MGIINECYMGYPYRFNFLISHLSLSQLVGVLPEKYNLKGLGKTEDTNKHIYGHTDGKTLF